MTVSVLLLINFYELYYCMFMLLGVCVFIRPNLLLISRPKLLISTEYPDHNPFEMSYLMYDPRT